MITFFNKREKRRKNQARQSQQLPSLPGDRSRLSYDDDMEEIFPDDATIYSSIKTKTPSEDPYSITAKHCIYAKITDKAGGVQYATVDGRKKPPPPLMSRVVSSGSKEDIYEKLSFEQRKAHDAKQLTVDETDDEDNPNFYPTTEPVYDNSDKNGLLRRSTSGSIIDDDDPYAKFSGQPTANTIYDAKGPIYDFAKKPEPIYSKISKPQK
eukprot:m.9594 g.9594  ORF g.9594 m.9594 type:complete len:210 (-) comp7820_c0_seq1:485-1114(-)